MKYKHDKEDEKTKQDKGRGEQERKKRRREEKKTTQDNNDHKTRQFVSHKTRHTPHHNATQDKTTQ